MSDELKDRFCKLPWSFMTVAEKAVHSCCWMYKRYGRSENTNNFDLTKEWNHPNIQDLRRGVLSGSFDGCNKNTCFYLLAGDLPKKSDVLKEPYWRNIIENEVLEVTDSPEQIHFEADSSCNLECRMCRDHINVGQNVDKAYGKFILWDIFDKLKKDSSRPHTLSMCGNGEPFFSIICRDFLFNADLRPHPHINIGFNTNGLLLNESMWKNIEKVRNNISYINWSIEGSDKESYERCRLGGNFERVVSNINFIDKVKTFYTCFAYVVHGDSWRHMAKFVEWSRSNWNWDISFQKYQPTPSVKQNAHLNIFDPSHPENKEFLESLKNPIFKQTERVWMRL